jgi:hypothetical protein
MVVNVILIPDPMSANTPTQIFINTASFAASTVADYVFPSSAIPFNL